MSKLEVSTECARNHHSACNSRDCECSCHVEFDSLDLDERQTDEDWERATR